MDSSWERTWHERGEVIASAFGPTHPPDTVVSFSWKDEVKLPGACGLVLPPGHGGRPHWLYLGMGLSQPLDRAQAQAERADGKRYSAHGVEFGLLLNQESRWPLAALRLLMGLQADGEQLAWGDRLPFGLYESADGVVPFVGAADELGVAASGAIRALVFWPYVAGPADLATSTGRFLVLIGTGITEAEWECAQRTTSAHVLLLLHRLGVQQASDPTRACVLDTPRGRQEWSRIRTLDPHQCEREFSHSPAAGPANGRPVR